MPSSGIQSFKIKLYSIFPETSPSTSALLPNTIALIRSSTLPISIYILFDMSHKYDKDESFRFPEGTAIPKGTTDSSPAGVSTKSHKSQLGLAQLDLAFRDTIISLHYPPPLSGNNRLSTRFLPTSDTYKGGMPQNIVLEFCSTVRFLQS